MISMKNGRQRGKFFRCREECKLRRTSRKVLQRQTWWSGGQYGERDTGMRYGLVKEEAGKNKWWWRKSKVGKKSNSRTAAV